MHSLINQLVYIIPEKITTSSLRTIALNEGYAGLKFLVTGIENNEVKLYDIPSRVPLNAVKPVTTVKKGDRVLIRKPPENQRNWEPSWSPYMDEYHGQRVLVETVDTYNYGPLSKHTRVEIMIADGYFFRDEWFSTNDKYHVTVNGKRTPFALPYNQALDIANRVNGEIHEEVPVL